MAGGPKLIFSTSIEALLGVAEGRMRPATRKALSGLRIGHPHRLEPAYPAGNWAAAVKLIGADLFADDEPFVQQRKLGVATVLRFSEGFVGKAMFGVAKLMGARRSLERMTSNLRTGANFIETRLTVIDEKTLELWLSDVSDVPGFYAGLLSPGSELIPGWPDSIELKRREGEGACYELEFTR
jgi:uncharacterized protein (TIGR02265 family)